MNKAWLLLLVLLVPVAGAHVGPDTSRQHEGKSYTNGVLRVLHDCTDDYGYHANHVGEDGHDLVFLDVWEGPDPTAGGSGEPMVFLFLGVGVQGPAATATAPYLKVNQIEFSLPNGETIATHVWTRRAGQDNDGNPAFHPYRPAGGLEPDYIATKAMRNSGDGAYHDRDRVGVELGFYHERLGTHGVRLGERLLDFKVTGYVSTTYAGNPDDSEFEDLDPADIMPGGYFDANGVHQNQGSRTDPSACPNAPPGDTDDNWIANKRYTIAQSDVPNQPPTADITWDPAIPVTGLPVTFTAAAQDPEGDAVGDYVWRFNGPHSPPRVGGSTIQHTFPDDGTYEVSVTLTDALGAQGTATQEITIQNRGPVADFEFRPIRPIIGQVVNFTSNTYDPDGEVVHWTWHWNDGTPPTTGRDAKHTFRQDGTFQVTLEVRDDDGDTTRHVRSVTVAVGNSLDIPDIPVADFTVEPAQPRVGRTVSFRDQSVDNDGDIILWEWDLGDGSPITRDRHPVHSYGVAGSYDVRLKVRDDDGHTATLVRSIQVLPVSEETAQGIAAFTWHPREPVAGQGVEFRDRSDIPGGSRAWDWAFGDGKTSAERVPQHVYTRSGVFPVTITVLDEQGRSYQTTQNVIVRLPEGADLDNGTLSDGTVRENNTPGPSLFALLLTQTVTMLYLARRRR